MITKPNSLFEKGELEQKFRIFQEKTAVIRQEEEIKQDREAAQIASKRASRK